MMAIAKNVVNFWGKTMKSWRVELICGSEITWGSTYKERDFSRGCAITVTVCNYPHTSDTHTENS